jgi:hypothetical protein
MYRHAKLWLSTSHVRTIGHLWNAHVKGRLELQAARKKMRSPCDVEEGCLWATSLMRRLAWQSGSSPMGVGISKHQVMPDFDTHRTDLYSILKSLVRKHSW